MLLDITIVSLAVFVFQSVFCYAKAYITVRLSKCDDANLKNEKFFCYLYKQGEIYFTPHPTYVVSITTICVDIFVCLSGCMPPIFVNRREKRETESQTNTGCSRTSCQTFLLLRLCWNWAGWRPLHTILFFSRRVPRKRRRRSRHVKAAARASISPSANITASPAERWAQMERDKFGRCFWWDGEKSGGTSGNFRQITVCCSLSVLLQAICAKCSKMDNKTSRVCPECFEASLSIENLGTGEHRRKTAPEVRTKKYRHTHNE